MKQRNKIGNKNRKAGQVNRLLCNERRKNIKEGGKTCSNPNFIVMQ